MKQFIRYLYEYEQDKRIRNIGFVKVEQDTDRCIVHMHGKGLRLGSQTELELYIFYTKSGTCMGIAQGRIENINPALNYRLEFTTEDVEQFTDMEQIEGIILKNRAGGCYAAVWTDMPVNIGEMRIAVSRGEDVAVPAEPEVEEPVNEESEPETAEPEPAESATVESGTSELEGVPEEQPVFEENVLEERALETSETLEEENSVEVTMAEEVPEIQDSQSEEDEPDMVSAAEAALEMEEEEIDSYIEPSGTKYYKIQRQDIAKLPRCEWRLANNSFLLHGFYNYHHLLMIEEDGYCFIGVPGIFHEKERAAAQAFGFSQFQRLNDGEIELSEDEMNTYEDFGYWCRQVKTN